MGRARLTLALACIGLLGCSLNPQPLPPDQPPQDASLPQTNVASDSGPGPAGDASGGARTDASVADAGLPPAPSDAGTSDASLDALDDALGDAAMDAFAPEGGD